MNSAVEVRGVYDHNQKELQLPKECTIWILYLKIQYVRIVQDLVCYILIGVAICCGYLSFSYHCTAVKDRNLERQTVVPSLTSWE